MRVNQSGTMGGTMTYTYLGDGTRAAARAGADASSHAGKEEQDIAGMDLGLLDFGARYYDSFTCRWNAVDPLAHKYFPMSPYNYCGNDPVNFLDPDGNAWLPVTNEGGELDYLWIPEDQSYNEDGSLKEGLYHQAIRFIDNHIVMSNPVYNLGSSTAIVYKADGSTESFDACTIPSDDTKYPTVPAGCYEAAVGTHKGSYTALKMFDIGKGLDNNTISLGEPNVAHPDKNYIKGANIHKAGVRNFTGVGNDGRPVSAGCFLISREEDTWNSFIGLFNNNEQKNNIISISVIR